jgi:hypothetical protein
MKLRFQAGYGVTFSYFAEITKHVIERRTSTSDRRMKLDEGVRSPINFWVTCFLGDPLPSPFPFEYREGWEVDS